MRTMMLPRTLPTAKEVSLARESSRTLSAILQTRSKTRLVDIADDRGNSHQVRVPVSVLRLLVTVLTEIGNGNAVSVIPVHALLTTQEAADLLNVSRPYLVQLLENDEMPFQWVGTHRRVRFQDLMTYKETIDAARRKVLAEMAADAQELGLYE